MKAKLDLDAYYMGWKEIAYELGWSKGHTMNMAYKAGLSLMVVKGQVVLHKNYLELLEIRFLRLGIWPRPKE